MKITENKTLFVELASEQAAKVNGGFAVFPLPNWSYAFPFYFPSPRLTPGNNFSESLRKQNIYNMNQEYFS